MCAVNARDAVMQRPAVPLAEACSSGQPATVAATTTEITFGTYRPPPQPKNVGTTAEVLELREKVAFLTSQLVNSERSLQAEKDVFMASISRVSFERISKLQEELEASKAEIVQLRSTVAASEAAEAVEAATEAVVEAAAEAEARVSAWGHRAHHSEPTSPQLPTTPRRDAETSPAEEELRRRVMDLEARLTASKEDTASARETVHARDDEIKKLSETAKRLSEALRQRAGETELLKKDLSDEQAFSQGLATNKSALEDQLAEAHRRMATLTHERNDAGRGARSMAQELLTLRPTAIELEVWRLWMDTEIRTMTRVGKELGNDAFSKAAFQFVKKYKNGEAEEWVSNVVKNRNEALNRAYGAPPSAQDGELPNAMKIMYVVNKNAAPGDSNIPQVVAVPPNAQK
jgi:chromosome segregation ATPase